MISNTLYSNAVYTIDNAPPGVASPGRKPKGSFRPPRITAISCPINIDATGLAEAINSGLLEFKDSDNSIRMDAEVLLESIYFYRNSIEGIISSGLGGRMHKAEASLIAIELGQMINSAAYKNGSTIEERAINRETGLRLAGHFARAFLDDVGDINTFIERVKDYAQRDEMLDKGYYFWKGRAYESYKPVPVSAEGKRGDFIWSKDAEEEFEANEKEAANAIGKARATVDGEVTIRRLEQFLLKFNMIWNSINEDNATNERKWVFRYS